LYRYASTKATQEFRLRIGKIAEQRCIVGALLFFDVLLI